MIRRRYDTDDGLAQLNEHERHILSALQHEACEEHCDHCHRCLREEGTWTLDHVGDEYDVVCDQCTPEGTP